MMFANIEFTAESAKKDQKKADPKKSGSALAKNRLFYNTKD